MFTSKQRLARELIRFAWPVALQGIVTTLILFTDRLLLSRFNTQGIASLSISSAVIWSSFTLFSAYQSGITAIVGQHVGARHKEVVRALVPWLVLISLGVGMVIGGLGHALSWPITRMMASEEQTSWVTQFWAAYYMKIVFYAAPMSFVAMAAASLMQAGGDSKTPMWISVITGMTNLFFSGALIYGWLNFPKIGVLGAALGTFYAYTLQAFLSLFALLLSKKIVALRQWAPWPKDIGLIFKVSLPTFGERLIYHSSFFVYSIYIGHLGDIAMAAHQIIIGVESIAFMASDSLSIATSNLVAQKLGAHGQDLAEAAARIGMMLSTLVLSMAGAFLFVFPRPLIGLFSNHLLVTSLSIYCLRIVTFSHPFMGLADTLAGALRGVGDTKSPMKVVIFSAVFVRLGLGGLLAFPFHLGLIGIWIGIAIETLSKAIWLSIVFFKGLWKKNTVLVH